MWSRRGGRRGSGGRGWDRRRWTAVVGAGAAEPRAGPGAVEPGRGPLDLVGRHRDAVDGDALAVDVGDPHGVRPVAGTGVLGHPEVVLGVDQAAPAAAGLELEAGDRVAVVERLDLHLHHRDDPVLTRSARKRSSGGLRTRL